MSRRRSEAAKVIGVRVKALRSTRGWSQEKLARQIEMSRETVRAVESGERLAEWATLEALANAFEVDLFELVKGSPSGGDGVTGRQLSDLQAHAIAAA